MADPNWKYTLRVDRKVGATGDPTTIATIKGPHGFALQNVGTVTNAKLEHLQPNPSDGTDVMLRLTFTV